jgi:hypothetical protein
MLNKHRRVFARWQRLAAKSVGHRRLFRRLFATYEHRAKLQGFGRWLHLSQAFRAWCVRLGQLCASLLMQGVQRWKAHVTRSRERDLRSRNDDLQHHCDEQEQVRVLAFVFKQAIERLGEWVSMSEEKCGGCA